MHFDLRTLPAWPEIDAALNEVTDRRMVETCLTLLGLQSYAAGQQDAMRLAIAIVESTRSQKSEVRKQ